MKKFTMLVHSILLLASINCFAMDEYDNNANLIFFDTEALSTLKTEAVKHFGYLDSARALLQGDLRILFTKTLAEIPSPLKAPESAKVVFRNLLKNSTQDMPSLQYAFLTGELSSKECIKIANDWIEKNKDSFENDYQVNLIKKMVTFYFNPNIYYHNHKYSSSVELMKKLYAAKTPEGKRKNIIFVVGNQSPEQVKALKKIFTNIFTHSDFQWFSCDQGYLHSNGLLKDEVIEKALCKVTKDLSKNPHYISFVIDYCPLNNVSKQIMGHKIEFINPNQAESRLASFGILNN